MDEKLSSGKQVVMVHLPSLQLDYSRACSQATSESSLCCLEHEGEALCNHKNHELRHVRTLRQADNTRRKCGCSLRLGAFLDTGVKICLMVQNSAGEPSASGAFPSCALSTPSSGVAALVMPDPRDPLPSCGLCTPHFGVSPCGMPFTRDPKRLPLAQLPVRLLRPMPPFPWRIIVTNSL